MGGRVYSSPRTSFPLDFTTTVRDAEQSRRLFKRTVHMTLTPCSKPPLVAVDGPINRCRSHVHQHEVARARRSPGRRLRRWSEVKV